MKRAGHVFDRIVERDNLRLACWKALKRKRSRLDAREFAANLEVNLAELRLSLLDGDCRLGVSHQFTVFDPKQRCITAPCFRERVLHHAIVNVCEPVLERFLIDDTFACRIGKGRNAALKRARQFASRGGYFLKMDVHKYFESIPHAELVHRLNRRFKDPRLLDLLSRIIHSHHQGSGRGLPIGSLTSQHFANFYLGWFDRFVKDTLRTRRYVRYMDDSVLWSDSTAALQEWLAASTQFLDQELGLKLNVPYINRVPHGMDFLGCRIFGTHMTLNRRSRTRFRRKIRRLESDFLRGAVSERQLQSRAESLVAFTRTEGVSSWQFRRRVVEQLSVGGQGLEPGEPRRQLEQLRAELPVGEPQQEHAVEPQQQPGLPLGRSSASAVDSALD